MTIKELMADSFGKVVTIHTAEDDVITGLNVLYEDEIDNEDDEFPEPSITIRSEKNGEYQVFYERDISQIEIR